MIERRKKERGDLVGPRAVKEFALLRRLSQPVEKSQSFLSQKVRNLFQRMSGDAPTETRGADTEASEGR